MFIDKLKSEIKHQEEVAQGIMASIEDYCDQSLVAGGAPRNWHLGRKARDLDIYCYKMNSGIFKALEENGYKVTVDRCTYPPSKTLNINSIISFVCLGVPVQLICVDKCKGTFADAVIDHMDLGINKIGYSGLGSCQIHQECAKDMKYKEVTLYITDNMPNEQLENSILEHIPKIMGYFKDYTFKVKRA